MYNIYRQTPLTRIAEVADILKGQRWSEGDPGTAVGMMSLKSNNEDMYPPKRVWIDGQWQISIFEWDHYHEEICILKIFILIIQQRTKLI